MFCAAALTKLILAVALVPAFAIRLSQTQTQHLLSSNDGINLRKSHLSQWCAESKRDFLRALKDGPANEWVIVVGNEAADTDSLVSSLAFAYHLAHKKHNPEKAVALFQIAASAINLRPENTLALDRAGMRGVHADLLTLDQLPYRRDKISQMIKGLIIVDANRPLSFWRSVPLLGIVDHHQDRGLNSTADPRRIEEVASTASLVTDIIVNTPHKHDFFSQSLADLLLTAISLDSNGFKSAKTTKQDKQSAKSIMEYSSFAGKDLKKVAKELAKDMKEARDDTSKLNVTQLYSRDYKGDIMYNSTVPINVGYANIPVSFDELIKRSFNGTREGLFAESRAWTAANQINVLLVLTKYKKQREVILVVKHGDRLSDSEAERLFHKIRDSLENDDTLRLEAWRDERDWGRHRYAWVQKGVGFGRKTIRPIVEMACQEW